LQKSLSCAIRNCFSEHTVSAMGACRNCRCRLKPSSTPAGRDYTCLCRFAILHSGVCLKRIPNYCVNMTTPCCHQYSNPTPLARVLAKRWKRVAQGKSLSRRVVIMGTGFVVCETEPGNTPPLRATARMCKQEKLLCVALAGHTAQVGKRLEMQKKLC
jgi:hypothetical protein